MSFSKSDQEKIIKKYSQWFSEYGYSPKSLGWDKGKQEFRFDILSSEWDFSGKSILDIGCGFGDAYKYLSKKYSIKSYTGVDVVPDLLDYGRKMYKEHTNIALLEGNFLELVKEKDPRIMGHDIAIISGLFNFKLKSKKQNYGFINDVLSGAFDICSDGVCADFLSSKVDYELEHAFHSEPEKILSFAYDLSRNVVLRNDYFPFEFSVFISKHDAFSSEDTVFNSYKKTTNLLIEEH